MRRQELDTACLIGMLERGGRRHHEPRYGAVSVISWRELRRQEAVFDDEGGGRLAVDERKDALKSF